MTDNVQPGRSGRKRAVAVGTGVLAGAIASGGALLLGPGILQRRLLRRGRGEARRTVGPRHAVRGQGRGRQEARGRAEPPDGPLTLRTLPSSNPVLALRIGFELELLAPRGSSRESLAA